MTLKVTACIVNLRCQESSGQGVFHVVDVLVKETHNFKLPVELGLIDLSDRTHLLDGLLDLVGEDLLLTGNFGGWHRVGSLLRPIEGRELLHVLALEAEVDDVVFDKCLVSQLFIVIIVVCAAIFLLFQVLQPLFELDHVLGVVLGVWVDGVTHKGQPLGVVVQFVPDLYGVCILQVRPNVLAVEDQEDFAVLARRYAIIKHEFVCVFENDRQQMLVFSGSVHAATLFTLRCEEVC